MFLAPGSRSSSIASYRRPRAPPQDHVQVSSTSAAQCSLGSDFGGMGRRRASMWLPAVESPRCGDLILVRSGPFAALASEFRSLVCFLFCSGFRLLLIPFYCTIVSPLQEFTPVLPQYCVSIARIDADPPSVTATPRAPQASLRTAAIAHLLKLAFKSRRPAPPCDPLWVRHRRKGEESCACGYPPSRAPGAGTCSSYARRPVPLAAGTHAHFLGLAWKAFVAALAFVVTSPVCLFFCSHARSLLISLYVRSYCIARLNTAASVRNGPQPRHPSVSPWPRHDIDDDEDDLRWL
ncbi:hypothetical protein DFH06DRAFT_1323985 [Mycena polygramma]|nr:hypothetical protein DFH06DRAFT_1323985 [Mycena polygramma]